MNLQNFLERSDQADLLHKGLQGLRRKLHAGALLKKSIPITQNLSVMDSFAGLNTYPKYNGKRLSLKEIGKKICPTRNKLAFTVLRLRVFPSTEFSAFCVKNVSTWLTILQISRFQVGLEFFSPSSTLKLDVNVGLFYS